MSIKRFKTKKPLGIYPNGLSLQFKFILKFGVNLSNLTKNNLQLIFSILLITVYFVFGI